MKWQKLIDTLTSRKFWATVLAMLAMVGLLDMSDPQQAELAGTLAAGAAAVYTLAVALEDGLSRMR